jgi:hypothetical protein
MYFLFRVCLMKAIKRKVRGVSKEIRFMMEKK